MFKSRPAYTAFAASFLIASGMSVASSLPQGIDWDSVLPEQSQFWVGENRTNENPNLPGVNLENPTRTVKQRVECPNRLGISENCNRKTPLIRFQGDQVDGLLFDFQK